MKARGINIFGECRVGIFEYVYMFVMYIYMSQMTSTTSRMVGTLSGNPVPFLLPIVLTVILLVSHRVSFKSRKLWALLGISAVWMALVALKYSSDLDFSTLSYYIFYFYAIFIAYIHVNVYKRKIFPLYEHITCVICAISLVMWVANIVLYHSGIVNIFPETNLGRNILFIYNWLTPD